MGKFNRGTKSKQTLAPLGIPKRITNDISKSVQTRVGKQSKYGTLKARTPGRRTTPKALGG